MQIFREVSVVDFNQRLRTVLFQHSLVFCNLCSMVSGMHACNLIKICPFARNINRIVSFEVIKHLRSAWDTVFKVMPDEPSVAMPI